MVEILKEDLICNNCLKKLGEIQFLAGKGKNRMRQNMLSHVQNRGFLFCDDICSFEFYKREFGVEIQITHNNKKVKSGKLILNLHNKR